MKVINYKIVLTNEEFKDFLEKGEFVYLNGRFYTPYQNDRDFSLNTYTLVLIEVIN